MEKKRWRATWVCNKSAIFVDIKCSQFRCINEVGIESRVYFLQEKMFQYITKNVMQNIFGEEFQMKRSSHIKHCNASQMYSANWIWSIPKNSWSDYTFIFSLFLSMLLFCLFMWMTIALFSLEVEFSISLISSELEN